jgi:hypothetical protein
MTHEAIVAALKSDVETHRDVYAIRINPTLQGGTSAQDQDPRGSRDVQRPVRVRRGSARGPLELELTAVPRTIPGTPRTV